MNLSIHTAPIVQQLQLLETKAGIEPKATTIIDEVKGYRARADDAIVEPLFSAINFIEKFHTLCNDIAYALMFFVYKIGRGKGEGKTLSSSSAGIVSDVHSTGHKLVLRVAW
ncbi:MAG: hypothetical protein ACOH2K_04945 [Burkholderiaceae bacterium]